MFRIRARSGLVIEVLLESNLHVIEAGCFGWLG